MRSPHSTSNTPTNDREAILDARIEHMDSAALDMIVRGFTATGKAMLVFVRELRR